MRLIGQGVAVMKEVPVCVGDFVCAQGLELDAGVHHTPALLLDFLALFALQGGEEVGEIDVGRWLALRPMELHRAAHHPAGGAGSAGVGLVQEQQVRR